MDVNEMAAAVFANMREYVGKALGPLADRIKALEERPPAKDGKDADPAQIEEAVVKAIPTWVDQLRAEFTRRYEGDIAALRSQEIPKLVEDLVKAIPPPKDGKDGESVTAEDLFPVVEVELAKWALTFERRAHDVLNKAIANMPKPEPAKDGRDGLEIEDFEMSLGEDGRTLSVSLKRGEVEVSKSVVLPTVLDAGFYRPGKSYEKGDGVSFGGSFWIAQKQTDTKPDGENAAWRLAVKKGRDMRQLDPSAPPVRTREPVRVGRPPRSEQS